MTKFVPHPLINSILRKRSAELRKYQCYSTWYYEKDNKNIVICTTKPGYWIGLHGNDVTELKREINECLAKYNIEQVNIKFIECAS